VAGCTLDALSRRGAAALTLRNEGIAPGDGVQAD